MLLFAGLLALLIGLPAHAENLNLHGLSASPENDCKARSQKIVDAGVPLDLLERMAKGSDAGKTNSGDRAFVVDYSKPPHDKRFFSIDLKTGDVQGYRVSHGKGSGPADHVDHLSNDYGSHDSPEGLFKIGSVYKSEHQGDIYVVNGLQPGNSKTAERVLGVQACNYVHETGDAPIGRSAGSFCMDPSTFAHIKNSLPGSLLYSGLSGSETAKKDAKLGPSDELCKLFGFSGNNRSIQIHGSGKVD